MSTEFRLKGWHVLAMLIGFFAVIFAANAVFLTVAVRSFPGEQEKKSYLQGLNYNETIKARAAQEALGWSAAITAVETTRAGTGVRLTFKDRWDSPLGGLAIEGVIRRPVTDDFDQPVTFTAEAPGTYTALIPALTEGVWTLSATATHIGGGTFRFETDLDL